MNVKEIARYEVTSIHMHVSDRGCSWDVTFSEIEQGRRLGPSIEYSFPVDPQVKLGDRFVLIRENAE